MVHKIIRECTGLHPNDVVLGIQKEEVVLETENDYM